MESSSEPPPEGPRYRVTETLGEGGMGAVYRAVDLRSGREVALKRLHRNVKDPALAGELFEREFHALSQLAHPRIIEVYDYGIDEQGAFYTMELLGGQDLRAWKGAHWTVLCPLLRDVASSLAIIHARRLVHCDLTPRNVRCTADGRAKLLDFGAMAPMGPPRRVVGTPPFASPEMVQGQSLDGRSDLFGFGALSYWLLTGRHAFPARELGQLRALWTAPVRAPHELDAEIPRALSDLVMDCIALHPAARPRSAAVVMERLCGIAGLPLDEQPDVALAYLTTPRLVGRDPLLARVRAGLVEGLRGSGTAYCVRGTPGSGRTRFLEACVLEAKLLGAAVLRVGPGVAGPGELNALRTLCEQLFELAPARAARAARLHRTMLDHLMPSAQAPSDSAPALPPSPERRHLLASIRDFVVAATRSMRLVIAIDDADRIDEGSLSVLLSLAQSAKRRPTCILFALDDSRGLDGPLGLLDELAEPIRLTPLDEVETELLVESLFGNVAHTFTLAHRLHAVAGGNPRATMQLVAQLMERGVIRYEAGSFLLPEQLSDADLPGTLGDALRERLRDLEGDALELLQCLSLTESLELSPSQYERLLGSGDRGRAFRALDQLVTRGLLVPQGERYRLADPLLREVATAELTDAVRRELHARLARCFEPDGKITRRGYHLMESGEPEAAIRVLLAKYLADPAEPRDPLEDYVPGLLDLLERASNAARDLPLSPAIKVELAMKTCGASQFLADIARFRRLAPPLREQLERESGLRDFDDVDPALPPMERLTIALTRTQQRYDATPVAQRGLAPVDAVRELSRMCAMYSGIAAAAQDTELLRERPSLAPLVPLAPAIGCIERFAEATAWLMQGRSERACVALRALIERLNEPDLGGLGVLYHRSMLLGAMYIVGLIEASSGLPHAGKSVERLEGEAGHRVNAQRVHQICHLLQGRLDEARMSARRAELAILQDGHPQRYFGTTARSELAVYAMLDDLMEVKRLTDRLGRATEQYPGWDVSYRVGRFHYVRIQGDAERALHELAPALERARPLEHRDWAMLATAEIEGLAGAGRVDDAVRTGYHHIETCARLELRPGHRGVVQATAAALLACGRAAEAMQMIQALIDETAESGARGLLLGSMHELAARIAIELGDAEAFRQHDRSCTVELGPHVQSTLLRRHQRLTDAASRIGVHGLPAPDDAQSIDVITGESLPLSQALSRMLECTTPSARAECCVRILFEEVEPERAYLFGLRDGEVHVLATAPTSDEVPRHVLEAAAAHVRAELALDAGATLSVALSELSSAEDATTARRGKRAEACAHLTIYSLVAERDGELAMAAVVAFVTGPRAMAPPHTALLRTLANVLVERDDVDPLTLMAG